MTRRGSQVQVLYGPPEKPQVSDGFPAADAGVSSRLGDFDSQVAAPSAAPRAHLYRRTGEVVGTVVDAHSGQGVGGAWVIASGAHGIVSTTAADDGYYRLVGQEPGTFQLLFVDPSCAHAAQVWRDHLYPNPGDALSITTGRSIFYDAELGP